MATLTRAEIVDLALEAVGVKPAGVDAAGEDTLIGQKAFDSVYNRLRKFGLAPFDDDAVPEWAWSPFTNAIAADMAPRFGLTGNRLNEWVGMGRAGEREMARQVAGFRHPVAIKGSYF